MQITIGFSRPQAWFVPFSWLIRLVQRTPYSHVYIQFHSSTLDRDIIYQASGKYVNCIGVSRFNTIETITDTFVLDVDQDSYKSMIQYCIDALGAPYDVEGIIGLAPVLFMRLFGKKINNPLDDSSDEFCSKMIDTLLAKFTYVQIEGEPGVIMPVDIYNKLITLKIGHLKNMSVYK